MDRKRTTHLLLGGAAALVMFAVFASPQPDPRPDRTVLTPDRPLRLPDKPTLKTGPAPRVELVFALDTTGSMSGLIEGAKKKIWEIARFAAQGQPTPDLRIGLVAYRDIGDEYVTRTFDLSDDLDAVYQNLTSFSAAGGGDTPEHVAKALHEAVNRMSWSQSKNALRIVYLVGDAPPHTDYQDGFDYRAIAQQAGERGIRINTIRCGADADTQVAWNEISRRANGEFTTIDQSGGMADVTTPYDKDLSELNRKLLGTTLGYGSAEKQGEWLRKTHAAAAAPAAAQAERAGIFGFMRTKGKAAGLSSDDLVEDVTTNKTDLAALPPSALPAEMQAMSPEDRTRYVEGKNKERKAILDEINAVSSRRDGYLKTARPVSGGFDGKVRESLKKQAADVGLRY